MIVAGSGLGEPLAMDLACLDAHETIVDVQEGGKAVAEELDKDCGAGMLGFAPGIQGNRIVRDEIATLHHYSVTLEA
jgi:hypothetical protein